MSCRYRPMASSFTTSSVAATSSTTRHGAKRSRRFPVTTSCPASMAPRVIPGDGSTRNPWVTMTGIALPNDPRACGHRERPHLGDRHRNRLPDRLAVPPPRREQHHEHRHRSRPDRLRRQNPHRAGIQPYAGHRRWNPRLSRSRPLRPHPRYRRSGRSPAVLDRPDQSVQWSPIPVRALYDENFRFLLDLVLPGIEYHDQEPLGGLIMRYPDGSTAQISPTGQTLQHGPRRLCDDIAALHEIWHNAGGPRPDRYRLTINPRGHTISLDDPQSPHLWNL